PPTLKGSRRGLTIGFGGTINSACYIRALKTAAALLQPMGGRLLLFGPLKVAEARSNGLDGPNIEVRGLVEAEALMRHFREEADVLFVPMSFDPKDRANMEISFPSKLTDYTAVGVPLLIYGPPYCSAVRWARENPGVAEVVESEDPEALAKALQFIAGN